jgi:hypothetical protein
MRTNIPEKLLEIADEIAAPGNANLTRLTGKKAMWIGVCGPPPRPRNSGELYSAVSPNCLRQTVEQQEARRVWLKAGKSILLQ